MEIFLSDLLFAVSFGFGLYLLITRQLKLDLEFGSSGEREYVRDAWASKTIEIKGKLAGYIGLATVLASGFCVLLFKFGEVIFTV